MPKFLLLKHYGGGPAPVECPPMSEWTPEEISDHVKFMMRLNTSLIESGEFVDAQGVAPEGNYVRYDGEGSAPFVLDGPFAESKELIAGWWMVDVESVERAREIAAVASSAPGKDGKPIYEWIEVHQVLSAPPVID